VRLSMVIHVFRATERTAMPTRAALLYPLLLIHCMSGCDSKIGNRSMNVAVISECGTYALPESNARLSIQDINGLLSWKMGVRGVEQPMIEEVGETSTTHRWFFYWEGKSRELWFYSGDRGLFKWAANSVSGSYESYTVKSGDELGSSIPIPVKNHLPDSIKNQTN